MHLHRRSKEMIVYLVCDILAVAVSVFVMWMIVSIINVDSNTLHYNVAEWNMFKIAEQLR